MAYRSSRSDFTVSERDFPPGPPRRAPPRGFDDVDAYDRHSPAPRRAPPVREFEDADIDRTPAFLREDNRRTEAGPLVLRSREVESIDRRRRSPSPGFRYRDSRLVSREPSMERRSSRFFDRSPSPPPVRVESRIVERRRERSPSPEKERDHIRLRIEREREKERVPSPSPSPPPPPPAPQVIRGPTIEREVITHYRDIDHGKSPNMTRAHHGVHHVPTVNLGIERAKPPSPPPAPRRAPSRVRDRETDIDIYTSRGEMDIDVRSRARSRSRPAPTRPRILQRPSSFDEDDIIIHKNRDVLRVTDTHRRSQSAAPVPDFDDEAEYITGKIDARGRMGEAWNGATKDWTIVDVPPGTERVKMDGVGGGGAEVTWQRYNGVRRARFISERDGTVVSSSPTVASEPVRGRERERDPSRERERLSVSIYDGREKSRDREVELEEVRDRRISIREGDRVPTKRRNDMWTEITKDLVVREAIERLGYEYEETEWFFYVMQYLRYEDVVELVNVSDDIRRARRHRAREIEWERDYRDGWDRQHRSRKSTGWDKIDDERITEREVLYDRYYR
ncbi:hypothetical protein F5X99DRAFT_62617 [Biscogniauxia marginata]|nr:hypothetical protein F5X99DRAFT_62617 [Biscogniauxia marginata]